MKEYKILEIKKSIFEDNDREADELRGELKAQKTFLLNLMSSPGSGKTTTLKKTIALLKDEMKIGVMEADIDSDGYLPNGKICLPITNTRPERTHTVRTSKAIPLSLIHI